MEIDFQLLDDQTLFALQLYAADCLARQQPRPLLRGREAPRLASEALLDVFEPPACPAAEPPAPAQAEAEAEVARPRSKRRALSPAGRRSAQQGRAVGAADPAVVAPRRPSRRTAGGPEGVDTAAVVGVGRAARWRRPASPGAAPTAEEWLEPGEPRRGRPRRDRVVRQSGWRVPENWVSLFFNSLDSGKPPGFNIRSVHRVESQSPGPRHCLAGGFLLDWRGGRPPTFPYNEPRKPPTHPRPP